MNFNLEVGGSTQAAICLSQFPIRGSAIRVSGKLNFYIGATKWIRMLTNSENMLYYLTITKKIKIMLRNTKFLNASKIKKIIVDSIKARRLFRIFQPNRN